MASTASDHQSTAQANGLGSARAGRTLPTAALRADKPDRHAFAALKRRPIRIVLDGVQRGYNVGAVFRLCDAMRAERLVICGRGSDTGMRKLVQAARGTQNWVPWESRERAIDAVLAARAEGYRVVVAEQTSTSIPPELFVPCFPLCLVLGAETGGVSEPVVAVADEAIAIPMDGMANSLNVATAAAIIIHSLVLAYERRAGPDQERPPAPG